MTQDRLDKLKIARESALLKKKQMKEITENEKKLKKVEFETKLGNSKKALEPLKEEIVEPKVEPIKEKPKKINKPKPKPITPPSSSSDDETSSSSSEEEETIYKICNRKKPKTKIQSESSSSEEETIYKICNRKKPKKKIQKSKSKYEISDEVTKDLLYKKIQDDNYKTLFTSMFPNHNLM
jgi:hypothetical protein